MIIVSRTHGACNLWPSRSPLRRHSRVAGPLAQAGFDLCIGAPLTSTACALQGRDKTRHLTCTRRTCKRVTNKPDHHNAACHRFDSGMPHAARTDHARTCYQAQAPLRDVLRSRGRHSGIHRPALWGAVAQDLGAQPGPGFVPIGPAAWIAAAHPSSREDRSSLAEAAGARSAACSAAHSAGEERFQAIPAPGQIIAPLLVAHRRKAGSQVRRRRQGFLGGRNRPERPGRHGGLRGG